jgi:hypothetical protein
MQIITTEPSQFSLIHCRSAWGFSVGKARALHGALDTQETEFRRKK